jgi:hypothetical protein
MVRMYLDIAPQLVQTNWERPMWLAASTARQALQAGAPEVLRRLVRSRTDRHRSAIHREPMAARKRINTMCRIAEVSLSVCEHVNIAAFYQIVDLG